MEIVLLPKSSLKIKGKHALFVVDPQDKDKQPRNGVVVLAEPIEALNLTDEDVIMQGPGEYEIGGVKISASRSDANIIYNMVVDGIEIVLGKLSSFEKMQHKLKEQNIIIVYADTMIDASFVTSLTTNALIFYGPHAKKLVETYVKGNVVSMPKYSVTLDKLPQDVQTVILE